VISRALADRGAEVVVHYFRSEEAARALVQNLQKSGARAQTVRFDLGNVPEMRRSVRSLLSRKPLDGLVCNAALFYPTPFFQVAETDWDRIVGVNLKGNFFLCQEIGRSMVEQERGSIVLVSDVSAEAAWTGFLPYTISKAGLNHLVKGLAKALAPHVRVNGVAPGTVLPQEGATPDEVEGHRKRTLLHRLGQPEDVARAVLFLLEQADFVTGTVFPVDGGYLLRGV